jgi:predicted ATPase/DNA-binding SARP family transcriptional activator
MIPMDGLCLSFFGGYKAEYDGMPLRAFESDKARLLLAYLAVENNRLHRRENLAGLFWPEKPESKARHSLSQAISSLNKKIQSQSGMPLLEITPQEIRFRAGNAWLDAAEFEELLQACLQHNHQAHWDCPACLERLGRLAALYTGEFLEGLDLPDCLAFEDWLRLQRESYRMKATQAAGWLAQGWDVFGELDQALTYARRHAVLDPLDEVAQRKVMQVLRRLGRRLEALAQYTLFQKVLMDELGVEPEEETTALYQRIMASAGGERLAEESLSNLPARVVSLVGRQAELERLHQKLLDPDCRLLTVLGPGGIGKTCLALEAGRKLLNTFVDGVFLAELDTQQSIQSLPLAIAQAVGLVMYSESGGQVGRRKSNILEQVYSFLQDRRLLLILDGFEGLLHEADLVESLLQRLPGLKIMTTSRLRLNLAVEHIFLLEGLAFPPETAVENMDSYSAVQLFMEAALRLDPGFELYEQDQKAVAEICRLNQGIPLGILLAAAWVDTLPPYQIVQEIHRSLDFLSVNWRDLPDRQRSLRATFDHSWRLLKETERFVFLRLAVLRSSFTSERAIQVAETSLEDLKSLIEQSLLQRTGSDRFRIHDLLRQYAQEKLAALPAENMEIHLHYCQIYLEELAARESRLKSAEQPGVLVEIDQEFTDILAAWEWAVRNGQVELLEKVVEALRYYHLLRDLPTEGITLCLRSMQYLETEGLSSINLHLWVCLGIWLANGLVAQVEHEQAWMVIKQVEGQMQKWERLPAEMGREQACLRLLSGDFTLYSGGNRHLAIEYYREALGLFIALGNPWDISLALWKNAYGHDQAGNRYESGMYAEQALTIQRELGDPQLLSEIWADLGYFYMLTGDYEGGLRVAKELAANQMLINTPFSQALAKDHLGLALFYAGEYEQARTLFIQAIPVYTQPGEIGWRLFDRYILTCIDLMTGEYEAVLNGMAYAGETLNISYQNLLSLFRGLAYLVYKNMDKAEQELQQYLEEVRSQPRMDMIGQPLALLGYVAYRRGESNKALDYLEQALNNGLEYGFFWIFMQVLSVLGLMYAEAGDVEQAVELYATVTAHPCAGNSKWFEELFGKPLSALAEGHPAEMIVAAQERGRRRKLAEVGRDYLNNLQTHKVF